MKNGTFTVYRLGHIQARRVAGSINRGGALAPSFSQLTLARRADVWVMILSQRRSSHREGDQTSENGKIYFHSKILGDIIASESRGFTIEKSPPSSTSVNSLVGLPPPSPTPNPAKVAAAPKTTDGSEVYRSIRGQGKIEFGYDELRQQRHPHD